MAHLGRALAAVLTVGLTSLLALAPPASPQPAAPVPPGASLAASGAVKPAAKTLESGLAHMASGEVNVLAKQMSVRVQNFDYNRGH
jgi:hypothetical protein